MNSKFFCSAVKLLQAQQFPNLRAFWWVSYLSQQKQWSCEAYISTSFVPNFIVKLGLKWDLTLLCRPKKRGLKNTILMKLNFGIRQWFPSYSLKTLSIFSNFNSLHVHNTFSYHIQKPSSYSLQLLSYARNYGVASLLIGMSSYAWQSTAHFNVCE